MTIHPSSYANKWSFLDSDVGQDQQTSKTIFSGDSVISTISSGVDEDWYRVFLTEGVTYTIDMWGEGSGFGVLDDSMLVLYSAAGDPPDEIAVRFSHRLVAIHPLPSRSESLPRTFPVTLCIHRVAKLPSSTNLHPFIGPRTMKDCL